METNYKKEKIKVEAFIERVMKIREIKKGKIVQQPLTQKQKERRQQLLRLMSSNFDNNKKLSVNIVYQE